MTVVTETLPPYVIDSPTFDPDGGIPSVSVVTIDGSNPDDRDQDFAYPPLPAPEPVGTIGNLTWIDSNADGVYEPLGADGIAGTDDDEPPVGGVTVDLYRDLNGNGVVDPGEPLIGSTTTADANERPVRPRRQLRL